MITNDEQKNQQLTLQQELVKAMNMYDKEKFNTHFSRYQKMSNNYFYLYDIAKNKKKKVDAFTVLDYKEIQANKIKNMVAITVPAIFLCHSIAKNPFFHIDLIKELMGCSIVASFAFFYSISPIYKFINAESIVNKKKEVVQFFKISIVATNKHKRPSGDE